MRELIAKLGHPSSTGGIVIMLVDGKIRRYYSSSCIPCQDFEPEVTKEDILSYAEIAETYAKNLRAAAELFKPI